MSTDRAPATADDGLFRNPAARNYLFVALASLLIVAAVMFVRGSGSLPAALIPTILAAAGLLMRWTAVPVIVLVLLCYFIVLPFGVPLNMRYSNDIPGSALRLLDLVLVAAALGYFACHYRLLGLTHQAMPPDDPARPKGAKPVRRPVALVADDEFGRLFMALGACVLAGQVLWVLVASLQLDFLRVPPLTFRPDVFEQSRAAFGRGSASTGQRFLVFAGLAGGAALAAGLAFWYWRLARLTRAEAAMLLLDAGWRDGRRELNRQEKWRAWGVRRARRRAGLVDDLPPRPKERSVWGCLRVVLLAVLGPIALFMIGRLVVGIIR